MKKNNKKLTLLVAILLVGIGVAFAYFVGKTLFDGTGATTKATTANINGAQLTIDGAPVLNDSNIYPGHRTITKITATATGDNQLVVFNLEWVGINSLTTSLNFKIYRRETEIETNSNCEVKTKVQNGAQLLNEECTITNEAELTDLVGSGTIESKAEEQTITLAMNEMITATKDGSNLYYYIILEYPNLNESQNDDLTGSFSGKVQGVASDAEADVTVTNLYVEQSNKTYERKNSVPENIEDYILDEEQSSCTNDAKPTWDDSDNSLVISNLSRTGTECNVYFSLKLTAKDTLEQLGELTVVESPSSFNGPDTEDHGNIVYSTKDNDGTSYYYRGAAKNNWFKFGTNDDGTQDVWWRIIRINGDGTIRLIYTGMYPTGTSPNTGNSSFVTGSGTRVATSEFSGANLYNNNTYVGFYYGTTDSGVAYPNNHTNANPSGAAEELKKWYEGTNWKAEDYELYIDTDAGFCNDRTIHSVPKTWWTNEATSGRGSGKVATAYGPFSRLNNLSGGWSTLQTPSLLCGKDPNEDLSSNKVSVSDYERDLFTPIGARKGNGVLEVPVGLITADEVVFAGGFGGQASLNFLNTGYAFWTMSPGYQGSDYSYVFIVMADSTLNQFYTNSLWCYGSDTGFGIRPVINLKATVKITTESDENPGTSTNPYIVVTE